MGWTRAIIHPVPIGEMSVLELVSGTMPDFLLFRLSQSQGQRQMLADPRISRSPMLDLDRLKGELSCVPSLPEGVNLIHGHSSSCQSKCLQHLRCWLTVFVVSDCGALDSTSSLRHRKPPGLSVIKPVLVSSQLASLGKDFSTVRYWSTKPRRGSEALPYL